MPEVSVNVKPAMLEWAMQKARAAANTFAIETIGKWISGEKRPTFSQIEKVSKKISVPFGYFFLQEPPVESCRIADFRTVDSISIQTPSRDLIETVDLMAEAQEWMADYNKDNEASENEFLGQASISDGIRETAEDIRKELGFEIRWFDKYKSAGEALKSFRNAIMDLGILVMMNGVVGNNTHRPLNTNEFRAFTLIDRYAPLIFINSRDTENGKLFSILHELVHVRIGKDSFYNDPLGMARKVSKEEQFCNAVAAEILVPDSEFTSEWEKQDGDTVETIKELGKVFVCSRFVLLRKALDTGKISSAEYEEVSAFFLEQVKENQEKQKNKPTGGGDFYRTLNTKWDRRFVQALYASARSGKIQYRDAYRLTNTNGKTFHRLAGKAGEL